MELNDIGKHIKKLRIEKKLSQQKLADMIPIDRTRLSRWENDETLPSIDKIKILCDIFDISIDQFFISNINKDNK